QAEDGIRDGHVTGVQTCALPILGLRSELVLLRRQQLSHRTSSRKSKTRIFPPGGRHAFLLRWLEPLYSGDRPRQGRSEHPSDGRSEERRVGKECRSRWATYR